MFRLWVVASSRMHPMKELKPLRERVAVSKEQDVVAIRPIGLRGLHEARWSSQTSEAPFRAALERVERLFTDILDGHRISSTPPDARAIFGGCCLAVFRPVIPGNVGIGSQGAVASVALVLLPTAWVE